MVSLETERLILRPFTPDDLEDYAAMCADPEVMRYLGAPLTRPEAWRNLALMMGHWQMRGFGLWAVERRETPGLVGRVGLWYPEDWPGLEVGWTLRREFWGQGYATEAARASRDYAFTALKCDRIISLIAPENHRSASVAQRIGEYVDSEMELWGKPALIYSLDRQTWQSLQAA